MRARFFTGPIVQPVDLIQERLVKKAFGFVSLTAFLPSLKSTTWAKCFFIIGLFFLFFATAVEAQTVWYGSPITFTKLGGVDPKLPQNQDRITSTTWITRGDVAGLYNAYAEIGYSGSSPSNTEWATGELDSFASLTYKTWFQWAREELGGPPNTVGVPAVLHLIAEDIYIGIEFLSWGGSGSGGTFSYQRTTPGVPV